MNQTNSRAQDHWLFWPLITLLLLIAVFLFFFSENGFYAYQNKIQEKIVLNREIKKLEKQKIKLSSTLDSIQDEKTMTRHFVQKLNLYGENTNVLQFESNLTISNKDISLKLKYNLKELQRIFMIFANILLISVTFIAWKFQPNE